MREYLHLADHSRCGRLGVSLDLRFPPLFLLFVEARGQQLSACVLSKLPESKETWRAEKFRSRTIVINWNRTLPKTIGGLRSWIIRQNQPYSIVYFTR